MKYKDYKKKKQQTRVNGVDIIAAAVLEMMQGATGAQIDNRPENVPTVPPVVQLNQQPLGHPSPFPPVSVVASITAGRHNLHGPPNAYHNERYLAAPSNCPPKERGRGRGAQKMRPTMVVKATVRDNDSKPLLPVEILKVLPHGIIRIGRPSMPHELMDNLNCMFDTEAILNTYKLSIILKYYTAYPRHIKVIYDSADGSFFPILLT